MKHLTDSQLKRWEEALFLAIQHQMPTPKPETERQLLEVIDERIDRQINRTSTPKGT